MPIESAGILGFRRTRDFLEVLLVHPGGPFFAKKDAGAWSIPKGLIEGDDPLAEAKREFTEETGFTISGDAIPLGSIRQKGGKVVHAWAAEGDWDLADFRSNTFEMEWPPRSGKKQRFPEVDKAAWFGIDEAREKLIAAQVEFLDRLLER
jgi:predicted NUDIX family NTP pyrophosphohydrolase